MHLKFLARWMNHLTSLEIGRGRALTDCILGKCNCCCILYKATTVAGNTNFYKRNEWACDGDLDSTFHTYGNYKYRVVHALTDFLKSIVHTC